MASSESAADKFCYLEKHVDTASALFGIYPIR